MRKVASLKGHTDRATDVVFSPTDNCLATASADKTAKLWSTDGSLLRSFQGHGDRLCRIAFHPSGKYLGTASFDKSWRLWDINTGVELQYQEGHSRRVYGLGFHPDGSLAGSCGLDGVARVWDLRTGRSIVAFQGHVKEVTENSWFSSCFPPSLSLSVILFTFYSLLQFSPNFFTPSLSYFMCLSSLSLPCYFPPFSLRAGDVHEVSVQA